MKDLHLLNLVSAKVALSEEDKGKIIILESDIRKRQTEINMLEVKLKQILMDILRKDGMVADRLEDLKSENGKPFVAGRDLHHGFRHAISGDSESAYYCESDFERAVRTKDNPFRQEPYYGCGWVKGIPREEEYNEIGFMSGSEGVRYYCFLCGKMLKDFKIKMS